DLSSKDMKRDLYIVAHVIRIGRMLLNDSKKGPAHLHYRRPYGCAVLSILDVLQSLTELKEEKDFVLKVYTDLGMNHSTENMLSDGETGHRVEALIKRGAVDAMTINVTGVSQSPGFRCNNESEWSQIHENIIRKSSAKYSAPSASHGLIISLQLLRGDMEQIRRENPMIFNRGLAITRKLGFPDVIMPGDIRNDLYLTLEKGDFERGGKSVQKNIEVTMYVLYADGEILKDCISLGSGEPNRSSYHSFVLYHSNSPRWGEIIKLPIPIDRFRGSHLRFEFRHCSTKDKGEKKLFGFAFSPLMRDDGTTLSDDIHELYVYKCDENSTFNNHALYLGLPCCKEDYNGCPNIPSSLIFQRSTKESFFISTQLSSTKLTQNVDLLALLKWKAFPDRIMDILGRLRHVSGEEIVKFLQDILDTLFVILDDNTEKYGLLVFQSLVFIINLLRDIKYFHFRPVMDTYIQKHFAGALAYKELIRCLKWYMDCSAELIRQDHIQEAMRALEYLFKFIVQSRILYSRATCGMEEEQFRSSIQELFQSIRFVLSLDSRNSETLLFTQAALLNSFPTIFDELLQMFTVQEVAEFVRGTLGSMPSTVHIGQSMDVVKLQSIARTVDSRLFSFSESRRILLPVVLHHIHLHLRQQKELLICSGILGSIFSIVKTSSLVVALDALHPPPPALSLSCVTLARSTPAKITVHFSVREAFISDKKVLNKYCQLHVSRPGANGVLSRCSLQEADVMEEVEMMVESLLDVLLQTLLTIMSKSHAQEAVRGQRCPQCTAEITGEYVSCLLSLLRQMCDTHYQHLLDNFQSKDELKVGRKALTFHRERKRAAKTVEEFSPCQGEFLLKIFCVFRNLMKMSVFPRDWMVMRLLTSNIIVTTVQYLSSALHKNFTETDFDFKVWNSYFSLAVLFINQPSLQLEIITSAKRKKILDKYGDMRVMMAYELFSMWQNLGEHKIHFIPGMIGPFLGVTLVPQPEVRNIMIPIFHDMMDWEQRKNGNFKQVEAELIDKLDSMVSEGKGDESYRELFSLLLLEKVEQETWRETGISFVTSVTRLMERLLDYSCAVTMVEHFQPMDQEMKELRPPLIAAKQKADMNLGYSEEYLFNFCVNVFNFCVNPRHPVPDVKVLIGRSCVSQSTTSCHGTFNCALPSRDCMKGEETENKKIGCTVNLMNFYKSEINKEEMYIRYIHKLCDMHLQAENYTEAAFTLLLYCELLQWEERPLREFLHYPSQTEWQRKEGLCRKIIHYFNKGKSWEFGIPLCRELACQYESLYDYQSLSWIRKMEASYYDNIMEQQRLEPEFFRVGFYGRKFPFFLRNKEYVCRGHDYERLEAFQQRMLSEFPQAVAMQHPNHPDDAILQCDAQYLQIYAVTPIPDYVDVLQMDRVPDRVKSFYRVNNVRKFRYDRPFHKGPKDKENEFKSLWIERTTLTLTHSLPGISRWFEVERRELVEVSPLENAIQVVENKNQELRALISQYQHKQVHGNINLLSMCLNGVIDAAVNGGIARYQEVHVLGVGLAVHEKFVHPEMRPLHKKLIDQFQMMRASLYHQEFPGLDKLSPACSGTSTPRGNVLASHSPMSPESIKMTHRHRYDLRTEESPLHKGKPFFLQPEFHSLSTIPDDYLCPFQCPSGAAPEVANLHISTSKEDTAWEKAQFFSDEVFAKIKLKVKAKGTLTLVPWPQGCLPSGPSICGLSSVRDCSHLVTGSPSLPDKYRHAREMMLLLPTHRDRPSSAMYPAAILENGQLPNFQRALFQQVVGTCKPCSDPNLSVAEKAVPAAPSSWSLDSGAREAQPFLSAHMGCILPPPVPPRSLLHGHYSLHFDAFHHPLGDTPPALPARTLRKSPLHPIPASPTSPQSGLDGSNSTLSGSASSGVSSLSESNFGHSSEAPPRTDTMDSMPSQAWNADEDLEPPYLPVHYSLSESAVLDSIKAQPCRSHSAPGCVIPQDPMDPPALPPKPYHPRLPALEHDEGVLLREEAERPRGLHRKASLPPGSTKEEQARMAWEHGRGEQ
ncbi:Dedicator of cytokinesis protein 3, partial [Camelus dromedarius]